MILIRHSVLFDTDALVQKIKDVPVTIEEWKHQKNILNEKNLNSHSLLEIGFATFFLNRTNRSGILKGGIIGGYEQTGDYKIDCRFNKTRLISLIHRIALYKKHIKLSNLDAIEFLRKYKRSFGQDTLVYLDPPYYEKGSQLYIDFYNKTDHEKLSKYLNNYLHCPWIVSYDDVEDIRNLYDTLPMQNLKVKYSVQTKRKGDEIMIFGPLMEQFI